MESSKTLGRSPWKAVKGKVEARGKQGLDARPPGLMLAMHGHIETFSKMPKWLYQLFDVPVGLDPSHQDVVGRLRL
ncbi:hypothetical protein CDL15_Pgr023838 [Punica granatum]|uniref:Uncharacterized protein n=1 Tax=Punica granatum TaxID=22663 RepID=A0A218VZD2_PUNGR|nr:hypothetical protein CDL15_Pgr023838 [Punica granatum]